jgi:hypothetical protein
MWIKKKLIYQKILNIGIKKLSMKDILLHRFFFAASDGIVNENLALILLNEVLKPNFPMVFSNS